MKEFDVVDAVARLGRTLPDDGVRLGIGDDAAVLAPLPADHELVVCQDTLNVGTHFEAHHRAADVGFKALAVNLSDLAAMGAAPRWALMSLSSPRLDQDWIEHFLAGFGELARRHGVALIGGDTTRGTLSISVVAGGSVPAGRALTRGTAQPGDRIWVSGTVGDAALALAGVADTELAQRLLRPTARIALGQALRGLATACIDLSDGLRADLPRVLGDRGAEVKLESLPVSAAFGRHRSGEDRWAPMLAGGDDYELCFTAPRSSDTAVEAAGRAANVAVTPVGEVKSERTIRYVRGDGSELDSDALPGFEHF